MCTSVSNHNNMNSNDFTNDHQVNLKMIICFNFLKKTIFLSLKAKQ